MREKPPFWAAFFVSLPIVAEYLVDFCSKNCYDSAINAKEAPLMDNELGARIRALRKERGLSQEALAQALEVSRQAVTKWEDGSSLPSTANLFALSGFFGVPLAELTDTPEGSAPPLNTSAISEKQRRIRTKVLKIGAWALLAVSVPVLLWCAVQYFNAGPPIPDDGSVIGYADSVTSIYVVSNFPTRLFLSALSLFAAGLGILLYLKIKNRKGKTHDR